MHNKVKVLLVDDNEDSRELQSAILLSQGYEVQTGVNGVDGVNKLKSFLPDIIISDVLMPKMDGFEFCKTIKQNPLFQDIPLVFYSAQYTDNNAQALANEVGAEHFIVKPVDTEIFLETIDNVLKQSKIKRENKAGTGSVENVFFDQKHYEAQAKMLDRKLRELEEKQRELLESKNDYQRLIEGISSDYFIYRLDKNGMFVYVSPSVKNNLGFDVEKLQGEQFSSILTDAPGNSIVLKYNELGLQGSVVPTYEVEFLTNENDKKFFQVSENPIYNNQGDVIGLEGIAHDVTATRFAEKIQQENDQKLHDSLVTMIQVISTTVEKRDPYTAGHQQRVADLAVIIGKKMNLDAEQLEGLRLGGIVHDIGKISVPIEILTKPGKLDAIEYELIKKHSKEGYEILKNIDFPWPLAQMVLQHHERLDGSGYPQGQKSYELLLESKILAVADVIEAMSSHRPYRPSLGLESAMDEIIKHKGLLYDSYTVECCEALYKDGELNFLITS